MFSYKELIKRFGSYLSDPDFKLFLVNNFPDISAYNILDGDYMTSVNSGIEIGFTNEDAVVDDDDRIIFQEGNPIFSHLNLYPKTFTLLHELPFGITINDRRNDVREKAGEPTRTNQGDFLGSMFLIDHYKVDDIVVSVDYVLADLSVKHIQIRSNNLIEHLKL